MAGLGSRAGSQKATTKMPRGEENALLIEYGLVNYVELQTYKEYGLYKANWGEENREKEMKYSWE